MRREKMEMCYIRSIYRDVDIERWGAVKGKDT